MPDTCVLKYGYSDRRTQVRTIRFSCFWRFPRLSFDGREVDGVRALDFVNKLKRAGFGES